MNKLQGLEPLPEPYVTKLLSSKPPSIPTQKADVQKSDSPGARSATQTQAHPPIALTQVWLSQSAIRRS
jgi:hypothetical protein